MTEPRAAHDSTIATRFLAEHPDIETVEVVMTDLNGRARGKWLPPDRLAVVASGATRMSADLCTVDVWGRDVPSVIDGTAEGDARYRPVMRTLKRLPWCARPTAQITVQTCDEDGGPWPLDPRSLLEQVCAAYRARGLKPVVAPELEFHLFENDRDGDGAPRLPQGRLRASAEVAGELFGLDIMAELGELLHDLRHTCEAVDLDLESLVKELSPWQFEVNLRHVDDPLRAADDAQMLKRAIKAVAARHGLIASFMAKPARALSGSGLHLHVSVLDESGRNHFSDPQAGGEDCLRHAIGGLGQTMADAFLLFAPHRNSYRRFTTGHHAPTAPTWGHDNRNVALRLPLADAGNRRIEHRASGADANVYLVVAAVLAGILHGESHAMDPGRPCGPGEAHACGPALPRYWHQAIERFEESQFIEEWFGERFRRVFADIKRTELAEFEATCNRLEWDTYLTAI